MNAKLQESPQLLKYFNNVETETFKLYETLSKKINFHERSFISGLAYDSLKCAKINQVTPTHISPPETENMNRKKTLAELANRISRFSRKISRTNNPNYIISGETLKELPNSTGALNCYSVCKN